MSLDRGERLVHSYSNLAGKLTKYCARSRCKTNMELIRTANDDVFVPVDAVVISKDGGDLIRVFCSDGCATKWLMSKDR